MQLGVLETHQLVAQLETAIENHMLGYMVNSNSSLGNTTSSVLNAWMMPLGGTIRERYVSWLENISCVREKERLPV